MLTLRTFDVTLDNKAIDRIYFVGAEYTAEAVRLILIGSYGMDRNIKVKLIQEVVK